MNTFLNLCLQLVYDNLTSKTQSKLRIIDTLSNTVSKMLRNIIEKDPSMKVIKLLVAVHTPLCR
jgi:hypothetical protein